MRLVDGALAIPRLFILLLVLAVWERVPVLALILLIGATGWFATSRLVRGEVLRIREEGYVRAAEALGARRRRIIFRHLLPNALGPLLVAATLGVGDVILLEAGLSFLGLGIQPPTPSWGGMILDSREVMVSAPWAGIFPGLAIVITVLSANLFGDALARRRRSPKRMTRVLEVTNLRVSFPGAGHSRFYPVDGVSFSLRARRDAGAGGRVGLRQEPHQPGPASAGPSARAYRIRQRHSAGRHRRACAPG